MIAVTRAWILLCVNNLHQQFFSPTPEETRIDTELQEWLWYFFCRIFDRTSEERYPDEKHHSYGWNHKSNVHAIEEPYKEGCKSGLKKDGLKT